ncbi:MAG: transposase zinc-binding domain-containing protein, partial [Planctomycetota bacterium]
MGLPLVEPSVDPPIEAERRSWVGKRVWNTDEHDREARAGQRPTYSVLAPVCRAPVRLHPMRLDPMRRDPMRLEPVRRDPSRSVVNRVLREHLETFLLRLTDEHGGRSLPAYVERELRAVIACGDVAHGFCRVRCPCCALDLCVPFSCKSRGFCPSCGGRRMAELAAHLVDGVIPDVPTRQWVLTVPIALRLHLAADQSLCRDVASAYIDAVFASYARGARSLGALDTPGSLVYPGAVNFMQRFGSNLGLNVHLHLLTLDGVYVADGPGR